MKADPVQHLSACARKYAAMVLADVDIDPDDAWKFRSELERSQEELLRGALDYAQWVAGSFLESSKP